MKGFKGGKKLQRNLTCICKVLRNTSNNRDQTLSKESKASDSKGVLILGMSGFISFRVCAKPQNLGLTMSQSLEHLESKDFGLDPPLMSLLYGSNILL